MRDYISFAAAAVNIYFISHKNIKLSSPCAAAQRRDSTLLLHNIVIYIVLASKYRSRTKWNSASKFF